MAPWCAYLGSWGGSYDCSYYTFQQCMATASGIGNICLRNPRYVGDPTRRPAVLADSRRWATPSPSGQMKWAATGAAQLITPRGEERRWGG